MWFCLSIVSPEIRSEFIALFSEQRVIFINVSVNFYGINGTVNASSSLKIVVNPCAYPKQISTAKPLHICLSLLLANKTMQTNVSISLRDRTDRRFRKISYETLKGD